MKVFWKLRGVLLRGLVCLVISGAFLNFESSSPLDWRFQLRGTQPIVKDIVIVEVTPRDLFHLNQSKKSKPLSSQSNVNSWNKIFQQLQSYNPKIVIPVFNLNRWVKSKKNDHVTLKKWTKLPNFLWTKSKNFQPRRHLKTFFKSVKPVDNQPFSPDADGVFRHYKQNLSKDTDLVQQVLKNLDRKTKIISPGNQTINFRGPSHTFSTISVSSFFKDDHSTQLKNKIIILSMKHKSNTRFQTPVGLMNKAEIIANTLDNELANRWLKRSSTKINYVYLFFVCVLIILLIMIYPHFVSLVIILWAGTALVSLSLWLFDSHYFWIPIISPTIQIFLIYFLFIGYQLTLQENQNWRLEQERKYLMEVEELKNNFVSLISHDLKTPIAKIQAIVDHLKTQNLSTDINFELESLRSESAELHRYIHSILNITRVESKDIKIKIEPTDINKIINRAVDQLSPLALAKEVKIETSLEPLFLLNLDKTLIFEVILNVLENAIKYSYNQGKISIQSSEVDDNVLIVVEDNGPGISKEEQQNVFNRFHRGKEHSFHSKGSGLGLYLVKYFVELHHGQVSIESVLGQGTSVIIILPLEEKL